MALLSRLVTTCAILWTSPVHSMSPRSSARSSARSRSMAMPRSSASGRTIWAHSSTQIRRSNGARSSWSMPASARARVNRPLTRERMRCAALAQVDRAWRYSPVERSRASASSVCEQITASGVRSSWEASAVKRFCCSKASSRRSSMLLSTSARGPSSLSVPATSMRCERFDAEIAAAVELITAIGRSARCTRIQPPARPMMRTPRPVPPRIQTSRLVPSSSLRIDRPTTR